MKRMSKGKGRQHTSQLLLSVSGWCQFILSPCFGCHSQQIKTVPSRQKTDVPGRNPAKRPVHLYKVETGRGFRITHQIRSRDFRWAGCEIQVVSRIQSGQQQKLCKKLLHIQVELIRETLITRMRQLISPRKMTRSQEAARSMKRQHDLHQHDCN